jgi:cytochrome P450
MVLHPSIQSRAQHEIDSVIGCDWERLPSLSDRPNLPYVNAIVLELLRWNPAVPLGKLHSLLPFFNPNIRIIGLAHQLTQDDMYRGWHLKKGTVVWANIWQVRHKRIF